VSRSAVRDAGGQLQRELLVVDGDYAAGVRLHGLPKLHPHPFNADFPATPGHARVLKRQYDREVDLVARSPIFEFLHNRRFEPKVYPAKSLIPNLNKSNLPNPILQSDDT
jgi:hypothetical protein